MRIVNSTKQQSLRLRPQLVSNNLLYYKIESVWLVWLTIFANIAANWKHLNRKSLSLSLRDRWSPEIQIGVLCEDAKEFVFQAFRSPDHLMRSPRQHSHFKFSSVCMENQRFRWSSRPSTRVHPIRWKDKRLPIAMFESIWSISNRYFGSRARL